MNGNLKERESGQTKNECEGALGWLCTLVCGCALFFLLSWSSLLGFRCIRNTTLPRTLYAYRRAYAL